MQTFSLYTDGAARGNPGLAGAGVVIADAQDKIIHKGKKFLGHLTNNQAEYQALILGLKLVQKTINCEESELTCFLDSQLIARQMSGQYRVKNIELKALFVEAKKLASELSRVKFIHIPREKNTEADKLANMAIDLRNSIRHSEPNFNNQI